MCGRYSLASDVEELVEVFDVPLPAFDHIPRYNIAPTQLAPVVAQDRRGRRMGLMRWGLIPFWAKDPAIGNRQINARSETAARRPAFKDAFARRRCLVPADGFYEWAAERGRKQPYWISSPGQLLSFAGLWDRWKPGEGEPVYSFTILTRDATPELRAIHDRMPVIVDAHDRDAWLDRSTEPAELAALMGRRSDPLLAPRRVSTWVNKPDNDDPTCVEPVDDAP
jgi:putative SOS response-associated peptidase YedK